jgi:hypothetical protein
MKMPEKFSKKPWITMVVIVILGLVVLYALVAVLYALADVFDVDWLQSRIDKFFDEPVQ